jgi:ATP-dependent helicase/nuclease subunit B
MSPRPRVFTIPPSAPFLRTLARGILDGTLIPGFAPREKAELLADVTIYLPTRRATRALASVFLEETKTSALLLPRIVPLGDVDEEAFAFEPGGLEPLPLAISAGERRLALAKLIAGFAKKETPLLPASPAIAIALADELAHLMDDFITAGMKFSDAQKAVEEKFSEFDEYWKRSRDFLSIVDDAWTGFLHERGRIDSAKRRDLLLEREAERLASTKGGPVIAAGSTGTLPKVAELLRVIAHRENGAVVLPGLDLLLDKDAFAAIGADGEPMPGHPQFGLKRLIEKIGIAREAVLKLGEPAHRAREEILSLAFRPQADEDGTSHRLAPENSLRGISIVEAADSREEALAIAITLREALHQEKSAALVTPDRALARRVRAELTRWNIDIDDSAGLPLADSEAGRLARLATMAAEENAAPSTILAFLNHPYLRGIFAAADVAIFEIACLRGARPAGGVPALPSVIAALREDKYHRSDRRDRFEAADWDRAATIARKLSEMLAPLTSLARGEQDFGRLAQAHLASLSLVLAGHNDDREEMHAALEAIIEAGRDAPAMTLADYAESFPAAIREHTLRPARAENERLRILGPLEARMISADRMVVGGLVEGVWPPETHTDSWLNRPMRAAMGLDLPERRIGLSAHDFVQAAAAPELFLVRARKQGGVETIASRFVQRIAAIAEQKDWNAAKARGETYLRWARELEAAPRTEAAKQPEPRPPLSARPDRFSMSDMKDLTRDPYSIYARKILGLRALDAIDQEPGAADLGTLLHDILAKFTIKHPGALAENALDDLLAIGADAFAVLENFPAAHAIWWPRFQRAAKWFVGIERERRKHIKQIYSEIGGMHEITAGKQRFTLTARADRIEVNKDGTVAVLDFKTGRAPTYKEAILGFEPQLLLEAAIARAGGFPGVTENAPLSEVGAVRITGDQPPGEFKLFELSNRGDFKAVADPKNIKGDDHLDIAADSALAGAIRLLAEYAKEETSYPFAPRVQWQKEYNDYEHLARFKEWSEGGE